ncbi:DeoR/GlpR family DNA-binding transcription regulator [Pseudonocardia acaciae]|uniref:DeoR/GlpR family DNA-binding transcription regulator n=1 Tax=Pseudonocardia acaciae TaxID=551276 RepID=UPI000686F39A|nr:DeoR/GlpR family DNA-binding transcription regulator [Pseudonocardia acaciae]
MFAAERRQLVLELVRNQGAVSLRELAAAVRASDVTVRRDLRYLESAGLLSRRHGGAVAATGPAGASHEPTYTEKTRQAAEEKAAIAAAAVELVSDGDAVVLGAGTTTQALARRLASFAELTVVTNSLLVAQALARSRHIEVVLAGGALRGSILATIGPAAEQMLAGMRVTTAFISGNGLTAARGLSTPNISVASMDRALVSTAARVAVLADRTKIGVEAVVQTVPAERIDHLYTDDGADADELARLTELGVHVHVAPPLGDRTPDQSMSEADQAV